MSSVFEIQIPGSTLVEVSVAADFIGAKGVVDFVHELLQLLGCIRIGQGFRYLNFGNVWDLFRAAALMTLFFNRTNHALRVIVVFICWIRLLDIFTSAERIAVALLPIKRSAKGLIPVVVVTTVSFCAFMHAFHLVWGERNDFEKVVFKSFATLITTELPQHPAHKSPLELVLTYAAVIFFSTFILNIFIGVISEQYNEEKDQAKVTLKRERAQCCLNFLLRASVLPCNLMRRAGARLLTVAAASFMVLVQVFGLGRELHWAVPGMPDFMQLVHLHAMLPRCVFALMQFTMLFAQYQNPEAAWAMTNGKGDNRFLWLVIPSKDKDESEEHTSPCPCCECANKTPMAKATFHD